MDLFLFLGLFSIPTSDLSPSESPSSELGDYSSERIKQLEDQMSALEAKCSHLENQLKEKERNSAALQEDILNLQKEVNIGWKSFL